MSPNAGLGGGGGWGVSANEYSCEQGAQINFRDLTPYLTYSGGNTSPTAPYYSWVMFASLMTTPPFIPLVGIQVKERKTIDNVVYFKKKSRNGNI
jgi:hypothetical protein